MADFDDGLEYTELEDRSIAKVLKVDKSRSEVGVLQVCSDSQASYLIRWRPSFNGLRVGDSWHTQHELETALVEGLDAVYKLTDYYMPLPKKERAKTTRKSKRAATTYNSSSSTETPKSIEPPATPSYVYSPSWNSVYYGYSSTPSYSYSYSYSSYKPYSFSPRKDITDGITPPSTAEVCENVSTKRSKMGPHRPNPKNLADAIQRGCAEEVQRLIRAGAQVNRQFGYIGKENEIWIIIFSGQPGQLPLGWALVQGHLHIADLLLDNGARLEARDNSGRDAASYFKDPNAFRQYAKLRQLLMPFKLFYCKLLEEDYPLDIIRYILAQFLLL